MIPIGLMASLEVIAAEAKEAGEQGLFSGTFADALWTVLAFVLLLIVLSRLAWRPVLERLKARELYIQQQIDAANSARQQAINLLTDYKQQGMEIVKLAGDEAEERQKEILENARQEVLAIRQKAREDIEITRSAALEQFWNEAGSIVLELSREVLNRQVTHQDDSLLIRDAVEQIRRASDSSDKSDKTADHKS
ncbi:MAG: ATP synthase F0 subunit B [Sedimentisphaerales bacterium]|nr:ATP synthase F0 subunit B [Sedimentisphaerales bacterium]